MHSKKVILARQIYAESCLLEALEKETKELCEEMMYEKSYSKRMKMIDSAYIKRALIRTTKNKIERWQAKHDQITE